MIKEIFNYCLIIVQWICIILLLFLFTKDVPVEQNKKHHNNDSLHDFAHSIPTVF